MRSFCISLLVFILLMCSCKTKKVGCEVDFTTKEISEIAYLNNTVKIDTSKTAYFVNEAQSIVIEEDIIAIEYDKESGKPIKETKTKRKVAQDSDKVVAEEENKGQSEVRNDNLNYTANVSKKVESEVKEESIGGQESFGKWFGIVIGIAISILFVYLLKKFRVN